MQPAEAALLHVSDLSLLLPTPHGAAHALRQVSFSLARGQTLGLIGESGCGKSLTAMAIMGLLPEAAQVSGSIRLNGEELVGASETRLTQLRGARMAMVFQEPMTALNPLQPIWRQVAEPLCLHQGMSRRDARLRALALLDRVQLPRARERLDAYPHQLSGGQRQRVMIAMALACGPDLLMADEPTTALDATTQQDVLALMTQLVREDGMGLLLISHDLGLMHAHAQRVLVMYAGSVVECAPTDALFARQAHPYTRGLVAARARLGMARGTRLPTIAGRVPELTDLPPGCAFAERCAQAVPVCRQALPELVEIAPGHTVRCPRWELP